MPKEPKKPNLRTIEAACCDAGYDGKPREPMHHKQLSTHIKFFYKDTAWKYLSEKDRLNRKIENQFELARKFLESTCECTKLTRESSTRNAEYLWPRSASDNGLKHGESLWPKTGERSKKKGLKFDNAVDRQKIVIHVGGIIRLIHEGQVIQARKKEKERRHSVEIPETPEPDSKNDEESAFSIEESPSVASRERHSSSSSSAPRTSRILRRAIPKCWKAHVKTPEYDDSFMDIDSDIPLLSLRRRRRSSSLSQNVTKRRKTRGSLRGRAISSSSNSNSESIFKKELCHENIKSEFEFDVPEFSVPESSTSGFNTQASSASNILSKALLQPHSPRLQYNRTFDVIPSREVDQDTQNNPSSPCMRREVSASVAINKPLANIFASHVVTPKSPSLLLLLPPSPKIKVLLRQWSSKPTDYSIAHDKTIFSGTCENFFKTYARESGIPLREISQISFVFDDTCPIEEHEHKLFRGDETGWNFMKEKLADLVLEGRRQDRSVLEFEVKVEAVGWLWDREFIDIDASE